MEPKSRAALVSVAHDGERHVPSFDPESTNHYRHMTAYHFACTLAEGRDVLDYACGSGYGTNFLWRRAGVRSICGADVSDVAIEYCRESYADIADRFRVVGAGEVPFGDQTFDFVMLFQAIEHVTDDVGLLAELNRVLRPGGTVLITTPNVEAGGGDPDHPDNAHHLREYDRRRLRAVCLAAFPLVDEFAVHGTFRAGGRSFGAERWRVYRALRRLGGVLGPPLYRAPVSLADFSIDRARISDSLDLLFACRKPDVERA